MGAFPAAVYGTGHVESPQRSEQAAAVPRERPTGGVNLSTSNNALQRVRDLAERVAAAYGLDIFDVELKREGGQQVLRVFVDRPGPAATPEESVSIEDCARVAEDLGTLLDVEDVMPG